MLSCPWPIDLDWGYSFSSFCSPKETSVSAYLKSKELYTTHFLCTLARSPPRRFCATLCSSVVKLDQETSLRQPVYVPASAGPKAGHRGRRHREDGEGSSTESQADLRDIPPEVTGYVDPWWMPSIQSMW